MASEKVQAIIDSSTPSPCSKSPSSKALQEACVTAAVAAAPPPPPAAAQAAPVEEEQTEFSVLLTNAGANRIPVIKVAGDHRPGPQGGQGPHGQPAQGRQGRRGQGRSRSGRAKLTEVGATVEVK